MDKYFKDDNEDIANDLICFGDEIRNATNKDEVENIWKQIRELDEQCHTFIRFNPNLLKNESP